VSANKVQQFITDSESLANILHKNTCTQVLSRIRREVQQIIDELGHNKDLLESILKDKLQEIDARRHELDNIKQKAVEDMLKEDKEYQTLACANLEQAIGARETIQLSASNSEHNTSSETEVGVGGFGGFGFGQAGESTLNSFKGWF